MQAGDDRDSVVFGRPVDFEFMSPSDWLDFHCEVYDVVADLDLDIMRIDPGAIRLEDGRSIGLLEVAQHCNLRPRADWKSMISSHLRTIGEHLDVAASFSMFDLRIRLVPDAPADADTFAKFGARAFADGIVQLLAVDVDNAVRCIAESEVEALGWDVEEAWRSAVMQTEMFEQPEELHQIDVGDASFLHLFGQRPYTASMIGVVDRLIESTAQIGEFGAIVSMPLRHSILVHPVEDNSARTALSALVPITRQLYKQGPGSVSPHLYWWQRGTLTLIPTVFDTDSIPPGIEVYLPNGLDDLIG